MRDVGVQEILLCSNVSVWLFWLLQAGEFEVGCLPMHKDSKNLAGKVENHVRNY